MGFFEAILLGILQGITEFLPVSSSGHLVLAQAWFVPDLENALAFDVALHVGTLVAVIVYFRDDLFGMTRALFSAETAEERTHRLWIGLLALATVPVVIVGGLFADSIEGAFHSVPTVGVALLLTAGGLWAAGGRPASNRAPMDVGVREALMVGFFQVAGLVPGISRSGSTIVGGLLGGLERDTAARFGFLLAIPAICGAVVRNISALGDLFADGWQPVVVGMIAAAVTGWLAIEVMMRLVRGGRLGGFALYCAVLGGLALAVGVVSGG